ncbi:hypothetical protein Glove_476g46 [Diversispora epigaea]|uniref:Uncharacterized protein n=1 Tax=Diversispora epigaea TaxID=1348612 RepID=A0A397GMT7_9GLOM|nr:hypothetical protein Glove_476g46 [Diversispora epigaea]
MLRNGMGKFACYKKVSQFSACFASSCRRHLCRCQRSLWLTLLSRRKRAVNFLYKLSSLFSENSLLKMNCVDLLENHENLH